MYIGRRKMLMAGLVAALATTMSVGYAEDEVVLEPSADGEEMIVISLGSNPRKDPEPACVALQIGMNLLMDDLNGANDGGEVIPADRVILFATLDGVELVAPDNNFSKKKYNCLTPDGEKPLSGLLSKFVEVMGGEVVVCPLCWAERGYAGTAPTYGVVANAFEIHDLFLTADKVIGF